jgi:hypothetical protein
MAIAGIPARTGRRRPLRRPWQENLVEPRKFPHLRSSPMRCAAHRWPIIVAPDLPLPLARQSHEENIHRDDARCGVRRCWYGGIRRGRRTASQAERAGHRAAAGAAAPSTAGHAERQSESRARLALKPSRASSAGRATRPRSPAQRSRARAGRRSIPRLAVVGLPISVRLSAEALAGLRRLGDHKRAARRIAGGRAGLRRQPLRRRRGRLRRDLSA